MAYGNSTPPEGAPVPPQELIGASIFVGLVSVLSISRHGPYLISLAIGRSAFDPIAVALIALSAVGFAGSLWLLALRRWAWMLCLGYAAIECCLRLFYSFTDIVPGVTGKGRLDVLGGIGELLLGLVFLVVLAFLAGPRPATSSQRARRTGARRPAARSPPPPNWTLTSRTPSAPAPALRLQGCR